MEKLIVGLLCLTTVGCATVNSGSQAVYKRYDITMPTRPVLTVDKLTPNATSGEIVRAYEIDLTNIMEYSLQLENLLTPIATAESGHEVEPVPQAPEKKWYQFWRK